VVLLYQFLSEAKSNFSGTYYYDAHFRTPCAILVKAIS